FPVAAMVAETVIAMTAIVVITVIAAMASATGVAMAPASTRVTSIPAMAIRVMAIAMAAGATNRKIPSSLHKPRSRNSSNPILAGVAADKITAAAAFIPMAATVTAAAA